MARLIAVARVPSDLSAAVTIGAVLVGAECSLMALSVALKALVTVPNELGVADMRLEFLGHERLQTGAAVATAPSFPWWRVKKR